MKKVLCILTKIALVLIVISIIALPMAMAEEEQSARTGIDLTPVLQALIGLLATVITAKVVPWIKARTTAQQQAALAAAVKVAVYAAEQLYGSGMGKEKMQHVVNELELKGYTVDVDQIEAAVRELSITQGKPPDTKN